MTGPDQWAEWLLRRRHGGNVESLRATLDFLYPVRDKVLNGAALADGETLLSALPDSSVDAVTTRTVLIYVAAKQRCFDEFHRVLRPGGFRSSSRSTASAGRRRRIHSGDTICPLARRSGRRTGTRTANRRPIRKRPLWKMPSKRRSRRMRPKFSSRTCALW